MKAYFPQIQLMVSLARKLKIKQFTYLFLRSEELALEETLTSKFHTITMFFVIVNIKKYFTYNFKLYINTSPYNISQAKFHWFTNYWQQTAS